MRWLNYLIVTLAIGSCADFRYSEVKMERFLEEHEDLHSKTITIGGQKVHFVFTDFGHDVLVVFVHGSPGSWNAFSDYLINDSLKGKYDMISIDRPGFGFSDYGLAEPSIKNQAFLINEVLKTFHHEVKILVGHSLGGPVVTRMAMDNPDISQGLVLLAASVDPEMEKYEWYRTWIKSKIGNVITPTEFWVSNEEIINLKSELEKMLPLWENIRIPVIVIHGTKDSFVPVENADFVERMIPDSLVSIRLLRDVRHFIPWTHAPEIVESIDDLRDEIYSSGL